MYGNYSLLEDKPKDIAHFVCVARIHKPELRVPW